MAFDVSLNANYSPHIAIYPNWNALVNGGYGRIHKDSFLICGGFKVPYCRSRKVWTANAIVNHPSIPGGTKGEGSRGDYAFVKKDIFWISGGFKKGNKNALQ